MDMGERRRLIVGPYPNGQKNTPLRCPSTPPSTQAQAAGGRGERFFSTRSHGIVCAVLVVPCCRLFHVLAMSFLINHSDRSSTWARHFPLGYAASTHRSALILKSLTSLAEHPSHTISWPPEKPFPVTNSPNITRLGKQFAPIRNTKPANSIRRLLTRCLDALTTSQLECADLRQGVIPVLQFMPADAAGEEALMSLAQGFVLVLTRAPRHTHGQYGLEDPRTKHPYLTPKEHDLAVIQLQAIVPRARPSHLHAPLDFDTEISILYMVPPRCTKLPICLYTCPAAATTPYPSAPFVCRRTISDVASETIRPNSAHDLTMCVMTFRRLPGDHDAMIASSAYSIPHGTYGSSSPVPLPVRCFDSPQIAGSSFRGLTETRSAMTSSSALDLFTAS